MDLENSGNKTEGTTQVINAIQVPEKHHHSILVALLILVIAAAGAYGVYTIEQSKAASVASQNNSLTTQANSLSKQITSQKNINNGIVPKSKIYQDPSGGIGLVSGAVTFTLPSGWKRVPANYCAGASIDSKAVCDDIAAIAPTSLIAADGTSKWTATISVYDYSASAGSASSWYQNIDDGGPLTDTGTPEAINISQSAINGYSALSTEFTSLETPPTPPDYTDAVFVAVHGNYAVVVSAQIQASTAYGNANAYDYSSTYLRALTKMMQSIRIQG